MREVKPALLKADAAAGTVLRMLRACAWVVTPVRFPSENIRSPAVESEPINRMRMIQIMRDTNTGTIPVMVFESIMAREAMEWLLIAIETPHHVRTAFMVAARSQAPNMYQTSLGSCSPCSGVKSRAIPAKSIPQNASERIVAQ